MRRRREREKGAERWLEWEWWEAERVREGEREKEFRRSGVLGVREREKVGVKMEVWVDLVKEEVWR